MADSSGQHAMFCLNCRYPLHSLESYECPECGRAFDPAVPKTYALHQRPWHVSFDAVAAVACFLSFVWFVPLGYTGTQGPSFGIYSFLAVACIAFSIGFSIGALRKDGNANKVVGYLLLVLIVPPLAHFVIGSEWGTIVEYWTYWHWVTPAW